MLEVKNLKKIYKTKNAQSVHALDGVSLSFGETGMVFLLGKSGSGKSTLLNVCGGLDSPSEGEVIVKGRSSKDFSQSDFDSYRNTFIGFIFQEYNILNEFSVEDNIALALELQGKPKDKKAIAELLEQVDLTGFAKRKPNTLSGGQKQRIAIARALVKSPEIIMADEPTGALDSNTGKQVFETLKKLSRDKLVLVVSHDRDFAEQYGDRIIELCDGKVISDVSKTTEPASSLSQNVNTMGDVLCIKSGSALSDTDFDKIKAFLKNSKEDVIIANDKNDISVFKKVARIGDGGKEVFRDSAPTQLKTYTKEESRFIRSKLPLRHAFKIGVSGLKGKPIRLVFTVLLCCISFILFGLLSTLTFYNSEATFKQTVRDKNLSAIQLRKEYETEVTWYSKGKEENSYTSYRQGKFNEQELADIKANLNPDAFPSVTTYFSLNTRKDDTPYWHASISSVGILSENNSLREKITGAYPKNKSEIVISSYMAELIYNCTVYDEKGTALELSSPEAVIGKTLLLNGNNLKVSGIIDSGEIDPKFEPLKQAGTDSYNLKSQLLSQLESGLHLIGFVHPDFIDSFSRETYDYKEGIHNYTYITYAVQQNGEYTMPDYTNAKYQSVNDLDTTKKLISFMGDGKLGNNKVYIPSHMFGSVIGREFSRLGDEIGKNSEDYSAAEKYYRLAEKAYQLEQSGKYVHNEDKGESEFIAYSDAELEKLLNELIKEAKNRKMLQKIGIQLFDMWNNSVSGEIREVVPTGIYISKVDPNYGLENTLVFSQEDFNSLWDEQKLITDNYEIVKTNYKEPSDALYSNICLPGNVDEQKIETFWELYSNNELDDNSSRIYLTGGFISTLSMIDEMVKNLSTVFFYVGLVMAVFAALLFSNFISVSISYKKKEIGILRAVGARSIDVFKIFFSESFVIAAICLVISSVACVILSGYINTALAEGLGASLFVFGVLSFAVLLGVALFTAFVSTIIPVYNAAKKKPVDSIRAL